MFVSIKSLSQIPSDQRIFMPRQIGSRNRWKLLLAAQQAAHQVSLTLDHARCSWSILDNRISIGTSVLVIIIMKVILSVLCLIWRFGCGISESILSYEIILYKSLVLIINLSQVLKVAYSPSLKCQFVLGHIFVLVLSILFIFVLDYGLDFEFNFFDLFVQVEFNIVA